MLLARDLDESALVGPGDSGGRGELGEGLQLEVRTGLVLIFYVYTLLVWVDITIGFPINLKITYEVKRFCVTFTHTHIPFAVFLCLFSTVQLINMNTSEELICIMSPSI